MIAPALAVAVQVIQAQARPVLDAVAAVAATQAISQVDGQPLFLPDPVHSGLSFLACHGFAFRLFRVSHVLILHTISDAVKQYLDKFRKISRNNRE